MARKSTKNISKVLGGLGAMYALSKRAVGEGVRPEDVEGSPAHAAKLAREAARDGASVQTRGGSSAASSAPIRSKFVRDAYKLTMDDEDLAKNAVTGFAKNYGYRALQNASDIGAYASPVLSGPEFNHPRLRDKGPIPAGDVGQFFKKGGKVSSGSKTASASRRGDGIAQRGKTRGKMV